MGSEERIRPSDEAEQLLLKFFGQVGHERIMAEVKLYRDNSINWHEFKIRIMVVSHGMIHARKFMSTGITLSWPKYPREADCPKRVMVTL